MRYIYILFVYLIILSCDDKEVVFSFQGKFEYEVTNRKEFESTYLNSRYGYLIGDLTILGTKINNVESLDNDMDYIISLNHPVLNVYSNSEKIRGEAQGKTKLKPLEVVVNKNITSNHLYIYKLDKKNYYRVILP